MLLPRLQLSSEDLNHVCAGLPCPLAEAAAAVHGVGSCLPDAAKLASCRLLACLMPSQAMADAALPRSHGVSWRCSATPWHFVP